MASERTVATRLDGGRDPLSLELGARIELLEQLRVLAHLVTCSECVAPSRLELQSGPGRHALAVGWKKRLLLLRVRPFWDHAREWMVRIEPKQLVLLDVGSSSVSG